ncbi:MAG: hypothetical protein ACK5FE_06135, partial [Cyanobacteriota bacterium]
GNPGQAEAATAGRQGRHHRGCPSDRAAAGTPACRQPPAQGIRARRCRRRLELGRRWQFVERLDGLDQPLPQLPDSSDPLVLGPWGIGFWRLRRSG